jgi:hypothetical protein
MGIEHGAVDWDSETVMVCVTHSPEQVSLLCKEEWESWSSRGGGMLKFERKEKYKLGTVANKGGIINISSGIDRGRGSIIMSSGRQDRKGCLKKVSMRWAVEGSDKGYSAGEERGGEADRGDAGSCSDRGRGMSSGSLLLGCLKKVSMRWVVEGSDKGYSAGEERGGEADRGDAGFCSDRGKGITSSGSGGSRLPGCSVNGDTDSCKPFIRPDPLPLAILLGCGFIRPQLATCALSNSKHCAAAHTEHGHRGSSAVRLRTMPNFASKRRNLGRRDDRAPPNGTHAPPPPRATHPRCWLPPILYKIALDFMWYRPILYYLPNSPSHSQNL